MLRFIRGEPNLPAQSSTFIATISEQSRRNHFKYLSVFPVNSTDDTEPVFQKKDLGKTGVIKLNGTSITVVQYQVK
jgi:hypothetical protein